jgi:diapolycopene oxygenase
MDAPNPKIIVIGAGLGGLSAAISLRAAGFNVEVFEKNDKAGGKLNVLTKDGFTFDLGPSIFTLPQFFRSLFERAGKRFEDYVQIQPVSPHWRNFFEDGLVLDLYPEPDRMHQELRKLPDYTPKLWDQWRAFLTYSKQQYDIVDRGYFARGLDTLWDFIRFYGLFGLASKIDWRRRMSDSIARQIPSPHLRSILEYFIKYVGSSATNAPGFMNLMPNIQFEYGLWYVKDGMYNLAIGLTRLATDLGIPLRFNQPVAKILTQNGRVTGVHLHNGTAVPADFVVSNMEVIPTYQQLLQETPAFLRKLDRFEPTCSGLVVHLGTNRVYPQLAHHNFFYSKNQTKHFDTVFNQKRLPEDPTIYLVAPTRTDPAQAPPGCDNIKILPHIPYLGDPNPYTRDDYIAYKDRVLEKLERMGLTDLRKHTVVEDVWTPFDILERYASHRGSIYGVVSDWKRNYGFKAPKQSTRYPNLYFTGGSANPGGGMPMVILCGQNVANDIIRSTTPTP